MKKSLLLLLAMLLCTMAAFSQMTDIASAITEKEKAMYEALKSGDLSVFEANMADNFVGVYSYGISPRADELEELKNVTMRSYKMSAVKVMQPMEGVAIITYALTSEGSYMNEDFSGDYYAASTWVMTGSEWKAVMHTEVKADDDMQEHEGMHMDDDSTDTHMDMDTDSLHQNHRN